MNVCLSPVFCKTAKRVVIIIIDSTGKKKEKSTKKRQRKKSDRCRGRKMRKNTIKKNCEREHDRAQVSTRLYARTEDIVRGA